MNPLVFKFHLSFGLHIFNNLAYSTLEEIRGNRKMGDWLLQNTF